MSTPAQAHPTALDVARLAGVSRTTVSLVLNGQASRRAISPATEQRVRAAADELGYVPRQAARALRSGQSTFVMFALPEATTAGVAALGLINALTTHLAPLGLDLVTRRASPTRPVTRLWQDLAPVAIVTLGLAPDDVDQLTRANLTVLNLEVAQTNRTMGRLQAQHLLDHGHRHLAYLAPADDELATYSDDRLAGASEACRTAGVPTPRVASFPLDVRGAGPALDALVRADRRITALCAYNDEYAMAALFALNGLGIAVPDTMAVIGVDDIPVSAVTLPALTTVGIDTSSLVTEMTEAILAGLDGPAQSRPRLLPHLRLVERQSA